MNFFCPAWPPRHAAQPEIDLEIDTDGTGTDIHPADADVSIVLGSGNWNELQSHRLFFQTYVPACSPALLVADADRLHRAARRADTARLRGAQGWLGALAESAGLQMPRPRKRIAFNNMSSLVRATERSAGIGLIPGTLSAERFRAKSLTRLFEHE